jgi:lantibiotic modifying enzyme
VPLSETEFIALVEAAADYDDLIENRYFKVRDSAENGRLQQIFETSAAHSRASAVAREAKAFRGWLASGKVNVLKLRDSKTLPLWAQQVRQMLEACQQSNPTRNNSLSKRLLAPVMAYARAELQSRIRRQPRFLPARVLRRFEMQLENRLTGTMQYCLDHNLGAFEAAFRCVYSSGAQFRREEIEREFVGEKPGDRLIRFLQAYPVLARLWSQLIVNWVDKIREFSSRLDADHFAIQRAFYAGRNPGNLIDVSIDVADPHHGGRETIIVRLHDGLVVYKPRSGRCESDWFSFLRWINGQGLTPSFRVVRILRRKGYCWMEFVEHRACHNKTAAHSYFRRAGGLLCATYLLGAIDCHRDNVIAAGDEPVLIDVETLFHDRAGVNCRESDRSLIRTNFLSIPNAVSGALADVSGFGGAPGKHTPTLRQQLLQASSYSAEMQRGFRDMWKLIGQSSTQTGAAFRRRIQRLTRKPWRRLHRSTKSYFDVRERSLAPEALRSGLDRSRRIALDLLRPGVDLDIISQETSALSRFDIPYFSEVPRRDFPLAGRLALSDLLASLRSALIRPS